MSNLNKKIKEYIQSEKPDYWKGVELYQEHPKAKQNVLITMNNRWRKTVQHEKLIYELEKLIGIEKHSGKKAILTHRPANIPVKLIKETQEEAPEQYEYKIPYKKLPQSLQNLVILKGQLYNQMEKLKRKLAAVGEQNDDKSIAKRKVILSEMRKHADKIKKIHALLIKYSEENGFVNDKKLSQEEINELMGKAKKFFSEVEAINTYKEQPKQTKKQKKLSLEEQLDKEFHYKDMDYWQRKAFLQTLRAATLRQEKRAKETDKPDIKARNLEKAQLGRKMIAWLENYFKNTKQPEK